MKKPDQARTDDEAVLQVAIAGHVDHGKSTLVGHLLALTGNLPEGKLERIRETCRRQAKPFEYAFLLDALKDEQAQGITIDCARCFFQTARRRCLLIDAPGHIEFLRNMVTGAARADAALLVIDAAEGVRENSQRHGYLLHMLGIRQIAVLISKMDMAGYAQARFEQVRDAYAAFLRGAGIGAASFVPVSGREGDNLAARSEKMPWYTGPTVLETIDAFEKPAAPRDLPLRLPVQGVYRFTEQGDTRRIVAGRLASGALRAGDAVVFLPSDKKTTVRTLEAFPPREIAGVEAGVSAGLTLAEQIYVRRGETVCRVGEPLPHVGMRFGASVLWLGARPFEKGRVYKLKMGTQETGVSVEQVRRVLDTVHFRFADGGERVERNNVAECVLAAERPVVFDTAAENGVTSRFVLVDGYDIAGGGIVTEPLEDELSGYQREARARNVNWARGRILPGDRARRYGQQAAFVVLTGDVGTGKKTLARELEARLFASGRHAYFLGVGSVVHGLDADIPSALETRQEHLRRFGEAAHLLLDTGMILIGTARALSDAELLALDALVAPVQMLVVHLAAGSRLSRADMVLPARPDADPALDAIEAKLKERFIIPI